MTLRRLASPGHDAESEPERDLPGVLGHEALRAEDEGIVFLLDGRCPSWFGRQRRAFCDEIRDIAFWR